MTGGEVAHCTGAGWLASYVETAGSFGHFLSPRGHCMSGGVGGERDLSLYFVVLFLFSQFSLCNQELLSVPSL